jgi:hypothetical protein
MAGAALAQPRRSKQSAGPGAASYMGACRAAPRRRKARPGSRLQLGRAGRPIVRPRRCPPLHSNGKQRRDFYQYARGDFLRSTRAGTDYAASNRATWAGAQLDRPTVATVATVAGVARSIGREKARYLLRVPIVPARRGPHAERFQLLGDGRKRRGACPLLPAKAIWFGNLSSRLVTRRRPAMSVMKVDCQLLARAFSR